MMTKSIKLKNDKYRRARGGYSRLLRISCGNCGALLLRYQKDGPGPLKRIYIDRIINPNAPRDIKRLSCIGCKKVIGKFYIYKKEKRPAYLLVENAVTNNIVRING